MMYSRRSRRDEEEHVPPNQAPSGADEGAVKRNGGGALAGIGKTALGVAAVRARESQRPDRLFDDPLAQAFLEHAPGVLPTEPTTRSELAALGPMASLGAAFYAHGVIRTRFFDDYLLAAADAGCRQVVLLAAGLDTRAFRLTWPDHLRLFELDLPDLLPFKESVLAECNAQPTCARTVVSADLRGDWPAPLTAAGFNHSARTAWLIEGLLLYLARDEAERLITEVSALSATDSQLAAEHGGMAGNSLLRQGGALPAMREYAALWKGGMGEDLPSWLGCHGWQARTHDLAAIAAAYHRDVPGHSRGGFLAAVRRNS
jgi:methyltransferase (TIGR00027 family)